MPQFNPARLSRSTILLYHDLRRQGLAGVELELDAELDQEMEGLVAPILVRKDNGDEFIIALSGPLTSNYAADIAVEEYRKVDGGVPVIVENELMVRGNLPAVTNFVRQEIGM